MIFTQHERVMQMSSAWEKWLPGVLAIASIVFISGVASLTPSQTVSSEDTFQSQSQQIVESAQSQVGTTNQGLVLAAAGAASSANDKSYLRDQWNPIHFKPAIEHAKDSDCLQCHQEVLSSNTSDASPAGLQKVNTLAWYQTLDTYEGEQMTFHQRHITSPFIKKVANMSCTTCHQGNNPRDETGATAKDSPTDVTMRKSVDPNICLKCHGQFPNQVMGLPGPWKESGALFQDNCMLCHAAIRTHRHQVNYLNAEAIEKEAANSNDTCYGCHGGRAWYRISYPYARHAWPGMGEAKPEWAKDRPTESEERFLIQSSTPTTSK